MIEAYNSTHKSILLSIRKAVSLYLFERNRVEDIPKVAQSFLLLDNYKGDRVPVSAVMEEVNSICNVLQDNYLGLRLNMLVDIEQLPFYKSVSECLRPLINSNNELPLLLVSRIVYRFFFLVTQSIDLQLIEEKGLLRFDLTSNAPDIMNKHQIDGAIVLIYRIVEAFCPGNLTKITITYRHISYELEYYQSIFGVVVESDEKISLIYELKGNDYYKNAASLLIKLEEELGRRFFINPLFNMLSDQFSESSYEQRCEVIIDTMIGMIPPTRSNVADSMNISISTLQRKLKEEGTSFQGVLEDTRKRLAQMYLAEKKLSTTDVAYLLGYQSPSQFFKVFKTWFGITPTTYRNDLINSI